MKILSYPNIFQNFLESLLGFVSEDLRTWNKTYDFLYFKNDTESVFIYEAVKNWLDADVRVYM